MGNVTEKVNEIYRLLSEIDTLDKDNSSSRTTHKAICIGFNGSVHISNIMSFGESFDEPKLMDNLNVVIYTLETRLSSLKAAQNKKSKSKFSKMSYGQLYDELLDMCENVFNVNIMKTKVVLINKDGKKVFDSPFLIDNLQKACQYCDSMFEDE